jgi:hypothetical protein
LEKESLLQEVMDFLLPRKYFIAVDQGWSDWDIKIYQGFLSRACIKVCTENHGGNKRLLRVRCRLRLSLLAKILLGGCFLIAIALIILGRPEVAAATGILVVLGVAAILYHNFRLGRILYHVLEIAAKKLQLVSAPVLPTRSVG